MTDTIDSKKFVEILGKLSTCAKKSDAYICVEESFPNIDNKSVREVVNIWEETKNQSSDTTGRVVDKILDLWESSVKNRKEDRIIAIPDRSEIIPYEMKEEIRELKNLVKKTDEGTDGVRGLKGRLMAIFIFILVFIISLVMWAFVYFRDNNINEIDDKSGFDRRKREIEERKKEIKFIEYMCIFLMIISVIGGLYFIIM